MTLDSILYDAADLDDPPSEAHTLAVLRSNGFTPDARAVVDAVAALHDLSGLRDGADPRVLVPGIARGVDAYAFAEQVIAARLDDARTVLLRRPVERAA